MKQCMSESATQ